MKVAEGPATDPGAVLARRFNVANLRVQLRLAENLVTGLDEFEREWDKFVEGLRTILQQSQDKKLPLWHPQLDELVKNLEAIRHNLASRQQIVLPEFRDPLALFLRTSVRTYSDSLWSLIGTVIRNRDGTILVPVDVDGEPEYQVSLKNFEINADEARGEITRRRRILKEDVNKLNIMLEEAQRAADEANQEELAKIKASSLTRLAWGKFKESTIGRIVWWFGEEPLRKWLLAALGAGAIAIIPPLRRGAVALYHVIVSVFSQ